MNVVETRAPSLPFHSGFRRSLSDFGALAVYDRGGRAGFLARLFARGNVERLMNAQQRTAAIQHDKVFVRHALGSKVFRQGAPLAARRQDVEDRIKHLADIHMPFASAMPRRRDEGLHEPLFIVSQITGLTHAFSRRVPAMPGCPNDRRS